MGFRPCDVVVRSHRPITHNEWMRPRSLPPSPSPPSLSHSFSPPSLTPSLPLPFWLPPFYRSPPHPSIPLSPSLSPRQDSSRRLGISQATTQPDPAFPFLPLRCAFNIQDLENLSGTATPSIRNVVFVSHPIKDMSLDETQSLG